MSTLRRSTSGVRNSQTQRPSANEVPWHDRDSFRKRARVYEEFTTVGMTKSETALRQRWSRRRGPLSFSCFGRPADAVGLACSPFRLPSISRAARPDHSSCALTVGSGVRWRCHGVSKRGWERPGLRRDFFFFIARHGNQLHVGGDNGFMRSRTLSRNATFVCVLHDSSE